MKRKKKKVRLIKKRAKKALRKAIKRYHKRGLGEVDNTPFST